MKKNYIIPSVEITDIQIMNFLQTVSAEYGGTEGPGVAESKAINFAEDDMWGDEE